MSDIYECKLCDYKTKRRNDLEKHNKTSKHLKQKEKEFVCQNCGQMKKSKTTLWRHKKLCQSARHNNEIQIKEEMKEEILEEFYEEMKEEIKEGILDEFYQEIKEEMKEEFYQEIKEEFYEEMKEEIKDEIKEEIYQEMQVSFKNAFEIHH